VRPFRRLCVPPVLAGLGLVVLGCSAASDRPPEEGDCIKTGDASCPTPDLGGGGSTGPAQGDSGAITVTEEAATTCGAADGLFTTNTSCVPCIEGQTAGTFGCCQADQACSAQASCLALLTCMLSCTSIEPNCPDACENTNPGGVQAYDDLSSCLTLECSPQCPTLPQGGTSDF
jgi:hypothetical protein